MSNPESNETACNLNVATITYVYWSVFSPLSRSSTCHLHGLREIPPRLSSAPALALKNAEHRTERRAQQSAHRPHGKELPRGIAQPPTPSCPVHITPPASTTTSSMAGRSSSLLEAIDFWGETSPSKTALTFLNDSGLEVDALTYADIRARSSALASHLLENVGLTKGSTCLLVYPPCLDFTVAYLACLRAGVIAVPCFPPDPRRLKKDLHMFTAIQGSSGATVALTSSSYNYAKKVPSVLACVRCVAFPCLEIPLKTRTDSIAHCVHVCTEYIIRRANWRRFLCAECRSYLLVDYAFIVKCTLDSRAIQYW